MQEVERVLIIAFSQVRDAFCRKIITESLRTEIYQEEGKKKGYAISTE
jgi:hypothetical protein